MRFCFYVLWWDLDTWMFPVVIWDLELGLRRTLVEFCCFVLSLARVGLCCSSCLLFFAVRFNAQPSSLCLGSDRHCELFLFLSKFDNLLFFIWCNMVKYFSTFNSVNALGWESLVVFHSFLFADAFFLRISHAVTVQLCFWMSNWGHLRCLGDCRIKLWSFRFRVYCIVVLSAATLSPLIDGIHIWSCNFIFFR